MVRMAVTTLAAPSQAPRGRVGAWLLDLPDGWTADHEESGATLWRLTHESRSGFLLCVSKEHCLEMAGPAGFALLDAQPTRRCGHRSPITGSVCQQTASPCPFHPS